MKYVLIAALVLASTVITVPNANAGVTCRQQALKWCDVHHDRWSVSQCMTYNGWDNLPACKKKG